jgi:uncharacterized cupin superfamily protein
MAKRPPYLVNWAGVEKPEEARHPATGEPRGFTANLGAAAGLTRLGLHHHRLPPGRRTSPPHAERDEEELVFILEGEPDLWQDGHLYKLHPGVIVAWPDRTGIAHTIVNNSDREVRLLALGEASRYVSRVHFPTEPKAAEWFAKGGKLWTDPPRRRPGPHDGRHGPASPSARKPGLPPNALDWRTLKIIDGNTYPDDEEILSAFVPLAPRLGLGRIGGGVDPLAPGRRTSWPHAEGDEEEFTFVLEGTPTAWLDGRLYLLKAGDFIGWPSGTGHAHTILNNSAEPARLFTWGEASRKRARVWYPFHAKHMKTLGETAWVPTRPPRFGPHNGLPDAQRKKGRR